MPNLRDIAKKCGCSVSVVSRALNPKPDKHDTVSASTKEYIRQMALEMGFKPNRVASFLGRGKNATIGVFLPTYPDSLLAKLLMGISEEADGSGFPISFHFGLTEESYVDFLLGMTNMSNSGIITYPVFTPGAGVLSCIEQYKHEGGNVILLNTFNRPIGDNTFPENIPVVAVDNIEGGRLAAKRLISRECEVFLVLPSDSQCYRERCFGFNEILASHGKSAIEPDLDISIDLERGITDKSSSGKNTLNSTIQEFVARSPGKKIGIFAGSDYHAVYALPILKNAGLVVGEDVLLIGFDDQNFSAFTEPALTTINQPFYECGRLVIRKLINMINHKQEDSVHLSPRIIIRKSA